MNAPGVDELLARAESRTPVVVDDGKSGSSFERVVIDGERYFLKRLSPAMDWIMRVTGDTVHRPYLVWQHGVMAAAPPTIDHTVVAMSIEGAGPHAVLSMLMHDVGEFLVPEGDAKVTPGLHAQFVDHLAHLSATFWGWTDTIGLTTMAQRLRFFAPDNIAPELLVDDVPGPIAAADQGWAALPDRSPLLAAVTAAVHADPGLITGPLAATPNTFLHGDWKMGNLGGHPDGRTILVDWAYPGAGPALYDLFWYLALNRARLPEGKEAAIERFRRALEGHGVATAGWWELQADLCAVAIMATFAWEKALGDDTELAWWEQLVAGAAERLGLATS